MENVRFLPTTIHGVLDYIVGILLILTPMIFGFTNVGGAAVFIPRLLGAVIIIYSIFTSYELGVFKVIPMSYHLVLDFIVGAFLALSPFIFGFSNLATSAWYPHVVVGILLIIVVLVSRTVAGDNNMLS